MLASGDTAGRWSVWGFIPTLERRNDKNGDIIMPMAMHKIESEALNLDIHSRASLVGKLLLSLDEPTVSEVEQLWLDEAERRLDDYRAGRVAGIPGNEAFKRAIAELS